MVMNRCEWYETKYTWEDGLEPELKRDQENIYGLVLIVGETGSKKPNELPRELLGERIFQCHF